MKVLFLSNQTTNMKQQQQQHNMNCCCCFVKIHCCNTSTSCKISAGCLGVAGGNINTVLGILLVYFLRLIKCKRTHALPDGTRSFMSVRFVRENLISDSTRLDSTHSNQLHNSYLITEIFFFQKRATPRLQYNSGRNSRVESKHIHIH